MAWALLLFAGLLEATWATGMKYSDGLTRLWPSVLTIIASIASFLVLSQALKSLPVGVGYAVWTGTGSVFAVILGILLFQESAHPARLFFVALVITGIVGLKFTSKEEDGHAAEPAIVETNDEAGATSPPR